MTCENVPLRRFEAACRPRQIPEYFGDRITGAVIRIGPQVPYVLSVSTADACPSRACTVFTDSPWRISSDAWKCRSS